MDSDNTVSREMTPAETARWLLRLDAKLDKVFNDHEQRLRKQERLTYIILGIAFTGGTAGIGSFLSSIPGM